MHIRLKKLTADDTGLLIRWRNENAGAFITQQRLTPERHLDWYNQYLFTPADHMYVITADGIRAGTIGLRLDRWEIGRVLLGDKRFARMGVMSVALNGLMQEYGAHTYVLRVLKDNRPAIRFYEKNGFREQSELHGTVQMYRHYVPRNSHARPEIPGNERRSGNHF